MEAINFTQAPEGATHFLRFASGYIVWCCVVEGGPNGQPMVSEWDSFNNYWVPSIHTMEHNEAIGLTKIGEAGPAPFAPQLGEAPKGATHHYEHGGDVNWYRETERGLYRWEQGSWCASRHKDIKELMDNCPLGQLTRLAMEQAEPAEVTAPAWFTQLHAADEQAQPANATQLEHPVVAAVKGDLSASDLRSLQSGTVEPLPEPDHAFHARAADYHQLRDACRIMREKPGDCDTEAVDALYKLSRELLIERDALPGDLSSKGLVAVSAVQLLRTEPCMFSADELADINELTDAELTKRDAAVCGGQKYLDATWHERGALPPVGARLQWRPGSAGQWEHDRWIDVDVIAHAGDGDIVIKWDGEAGNNKQLVSVSQETFRPIRTDHQVLVDLALSNRSDAGLDERDLADAILAAGFTRGGAV